MFFSKRSQIAVLNFKDYFLKMTQFHTAYFCESAIHHIEGNLSIQVIISDFLFFICVFRLILPDRVTYDVYTTCVLQCSRYMAMLKKVFKNITVVLKKTIKLDVSHKTPDVFLCKHRY